MEKEDKLDILKKADSIEISVGVSGVLPVADFENMKPLYNVKSVFGQEAYRNINVNELIEAVRQMVYDKLDEDAQEALVRRLEKARGDISISKINGKYYAHVTSILNPYGIDFDPYLLGQYASRGHIVHYQAEVMVKELLSGKKIDEIELVDPRTVDKLKDDIDLCEKGSLGLSWNDCNAKGWWKKYGKDIELTKETAIEKKIRSDQYLYCGRTDLIHFKYDGVPAVLDYKTSKTIRNIESIWKQLAAYAKPEGIQRMVLAHLNPSVQQGFSVIQTSDEVDKYFRAFLGARETFRKLYRI